MTHRKISSCQLWKVVTLMMMVTLVSRSAYPEEQSIWQTIAEHQQSMRGEIDTLRKSGTDDSEKRLALGLLLTTMQPYSYDNVEKAREVFREVYRSVADRDTRAAALYAIARSHELHEKEPNSEEVHEALEGYGDVMEEFPGHYLSQLSMIRKTAIMWYSGKGERRIEEVLRYANGIEGEITYGGLQLMFHITMADAMIHYAADKTRILHHLLAADEIGISDPSLRARIWVQIGELGRLLGRDDLAEAYYVKFINEFSRDSRRTIVMDKLRSIQADHDN